MFDTYQRDVAAVFLPFTMMEDGRQGAPMRLAMRHDERGEKVSNGANGEIVVSFPQILLLIVAAALDPSRTMWNLAASFASSQPHVGRATSSRISTTPSVRILRRPSSPRSVFCAACGQFIAEPSRLTVKF